METIGQKIAARAKARAVNYARRFNVNVYVFAAPYGPRLDVSEPVTHQEYNVATPTGGYGRVTRKAD